MGGTDRTRGAKKKVTKRQGVGKTESPARPRVGMSKTPKRASPVEPLAQSNETRNARIEECQVYVELLVAKLIRSMRLPTQLKEEFIASGMLGLVEAADRFKPEKGANFKAFAFFRIRGAVIDYVRSTCELHGTAYRLFKAFEASQDLLSERFERTGGRVELDKKQKLARAVDFMSKSAVALKLIHVREGEAEGTDPQVQRSNPEVVLSLKREKAKIKKCIESLAPKERLIVEQHYFRDKKLTDVAREHAGLSKSWVSRLHERAVSQLRDAYIRLSTDEDLEGQGRERGGGKRVRDSPF